MAAMNKVKVKMIERLPRARAKPNTKGQGQKLGRGQGQKLGRGQGQGQGQNHKLLFILGFRVGQFSNVISLLRK